MRSRVLAGIVVVTAALLTPAAAQAAHIELAVGVPDHGTTPYETAVYTADSAQDNRLTIGRDPASSDANAYGGPLDFTDPGETLIAGRGCTLVTPHHVRCTPQAGHYIGAVDVDLLGGDDELHNPQSGAAAALPIIARGGAGDDLLDTGPGGDIVTGGAGEDTVLAGAGNDIVKDAVRGPGSGRDVMSGGPGSDKLNYGARQGAVTVKLGTDAPAGETGENDVATAFESAQGGRGADRLYGDSHRNYLSGGRGADVLAGRGDADSLRGGGGRDRLVGGRAGDDLDPGAARDTLSCGSGRDVVHDPQAGELLGPCERITFGAPRPYLAFPPHPTHVTSRRVDFRIPCSRMQDGRRVACHGVLKLRTASGKHRLLGRARVGHSRRVRVHLNRRGRALIARRHGVVVTASLRVRKLPPVAWTVRISR